MLCITSSNFCAIMEKALKMPSVGPVMVTILSGDDPSDMLMRAPLWKHKSIIIPLHFAKEKSVCVTTHDFHYSSSERYSSGRSPPPSFSSPSLLSGLGAENDERVGLISYNREKRTRQTQSKRCESINADWKTDIPCQLCCQLPAKMKR